MKSPSSFRMLNKLMMFYILMKLESSDHTLYSTVLQKIILLRKDQHKNTHIKLFIAMGLGKVKTENNLIVGQ
jgi:hypothetical protein